MPVGLVPCCSKTGCRAPMQNGKRCGCHRGGFPCPHGNQSRESLRHTCIRVLRLATPTLVAAVLSSYITYLVLYASHLSQHAQRAHHAETNMLDRHSATGDSPWSAGTQQAASSSGALKYAPSNAAHQWVQEAGRRMRVAIVNEAPYHLEIVAGLLQIVSGMPVDVTWYQAGQATADGVLSPVELVELTGFAQLLGYLPHMRNGTTTPEPCDFAILVSPEYFEAATKAFLEAAKPVTAVVLAHNGMNRALQHIQALHPRLHFAALSPHVAAAARHALKIHTHWILPTFTFPSKDACNMESINASQCLHGFSIQGNFEAARRNYTRLWLQLQQAQADGSVPTPPSLPPFHLHLVGRGNIAALHIPDAVRNYTTVSLNLKFPAYYEKLQHTHALLMLLGNINYLVQKMSSTVVSSLMTGVPVVADSDVLASYTFLKPEHVFLMAPEETEMDVMQRVLRMSPSEVFAVRRNVLDLQQQLNKRAFAVLQAFMPLVEDIPKAPALV